MTVSVIIPFYNAEAYLLNAVKSAYLQDIKDLEIIAVNDGSTDGGRDLLLKTFPNVIIIDIQNSGPSAARNKGLEIAKGEYIQFLDSDDVLADQKINEQIHVLEKTGADIACGDWKRVEQVDGDLKEEIKNFEFEQINERSLLLCEFWCPPAVYLFRRSALVERKLHWNPSLTIGEDARFIFDCFCSGCKFSYAEGLMATYLVRKDSLSRSSEELFFGQCLKNILDIKRQWTDQNVFSAERSNSALEVLYVICRASYGSYQKIFEDSYQEIKQLNSRFIPTKPLSMKIFSTLFGYRTAEKIAFLYRNKIKALFNK